MLKLSIAILVTLLTASAFAEEERKVFIVGTGVEVHAKPEGSAPVVAVVSQPREVVEIQRKEKWVEIEFGREPAKKGWVPDLFVSASDPGPAQ